MVHKHAKQSQACGGLFDTNLNYEIWDLDTIKLLLTNKQFEVTAN